MLILTRRIGESLRIGDDVSLTVLGVQGNQVRIGADAPRDVAIHREEIYQRIQREKNGESAPPKPEASTSTSSKPASKPPVGAQSKRQSEEPPLQSASFYSSDGVHATVQPMKKKSPNVIVKKKRVIEDA